LLRMLAFRPASAGTDEETRTVQRGTAAALRARVAGAAPPPATAASSGGTAAATALGADADWSAMLAAVDLQGPARQLANHCVLTGRSGDVLRLKLDRSGEMFRRPQLEQKLAQALSEREGRPLRIEISVSDVDEDTPARRQAQASDERLRAAERAIESDPAVRAMREVFGATVQPGSVKPLNG
jgi:DNA polymerase III subunit gamma/tau